MSRYESAPDSETAPEPGSGGRVLRNRLGIVRKRDMDRAEFDALVAAQTAFLPQMTDQTRFTSAMLVQMHRDWLGGIYGWAGQWRTVELQKGGFRWPPAFRVEQNMAYFEATLLTTHTPCPPETIEQTARRMAEVHAELLLIHPFREGNGRLARWLADLMAIQAGVAIPDYRFLGRGSKAERERYLKAVINGYAQRYDLLTGFFVDAILRGEVA